MLDEFLYLEVTPLPCQRDFPCQLVEAHLAYLADEVLAVAYQMVGLEAVAIPAFGMGVIFVPSGGHVAATVVMPAVGLLEGLYLAATDAAEEAAGHRVPQPDV